MVEFLSSVKAFLIDIISVVCVLVCLCVSVRETIILWFKEIK